MGRSAFVDESFQESVGGGVYVLAAVLTAPTRLEPLREIARELRGRRKIDKLHWHEMDRHDQRSAAERIAEADATFLVAVGAPVAPRRQERARARCLGELVVALHAHGVTDVAVEARQRALDHRDVDTVRGARHGLPHGTVLHVTHVRGRDEPALWVADIVAGILRQDWLGLPSHRARLESRLAIVRVDC